MLIITTFASGSVKMYQNNIYLYTNINNFVYIVVLLT